MTWVVVVLVVALLYIWAGVATAVQKCVQRYGFNPPLTSLWWWMIYYFGWPVFWVKDRKVYIL